MNVKEMDEMYIANTYARFPLTLVSGKGSHVVDENGKDYIDLASGIAVNTLGYCEEGLAKAICDQAMTLQHTSNLYYTEPAAKLAKTLCERAGMKKVFFSNSGAEANECAIKAARKYAADKKGKDYYTIITLKNSFHGRTITNLAATGQDGFHDKFQPLTEGFEYLEVGNIEELENLVSAHKIAGIMFELVQGEGGVIPLEKTFVNKIKEICEEKDILMIVDEVQTGNGRSGTLYSYMQYGINPDIVSTAKGLAGGLPIGATMFSEKTKDVFAPGDHGSTFGGNLIACAAANYILSQLTEEFLKDVSKKSKFIKDNLSAVEGIEGVTGMGLMLGITTKKPAGEVVKACQEQGVLVIKAKDKVRLLPPLNITMEDLEKALNVLKLAIK